MEIWSPFGKVEFWGASISNGVEERDYIPYPKAPATSPPRERETRPPEHAVKAKSARGNFRSKSRKRGSKSRRQADVETDDATPKQEKPQLDIRFSKVPPDRSKIPERYKPTGKRLAGGMGEVLIYDDQNLNRKVAIKTVADVADVARLLDEITALQEIRSKHVVEIYDLVRGTKPHEIAIVEAFIPGSDLFALSAFGDLKVFPEDTVSDCVWHNRYSRAQRIHRDIKPNNMKFNEENLLKIFDFGLSRLFGTKAYTWGSKVLWDSRRPNCLLRVGKSAIYRSGGYLCIRRDGLVFDREIFSTRLCCDTTESTRTGYEIRQYHNDATKRPR